jgi:hypothetical protein
MDVFARLRLPDERIVEARPGDFVGRLPSAAVRVNDPRISEAHAIISLRQRTLRLLSLRGRFAVDGIACSEVALDVGRVIQLAPGLSLTVVALGLPDAVLGIEGPRLPPQVLSPVSSLRLTPAGPDLLPTLHPDADAHIWSGGDGFLLRLPGGPALPVDVGQRFDVGGLTFRFVAIPLNAAEVDATQRDNDLDAPLTLVLRYDTVHVQRGQTCAAIDGMPARLLTELAQIQVPVEWRTLARLVWPDETEDTSVRARFDRTITRLRKRLVELGLRKDLVRPDGSGRFELLLGPRDRIRDET